ncbi:MAG: aminotransferase class I/II-fold pyridoxal phosphate-dependent enzyme [Deinococcota bacterium]
MSSSTLDLASLQVRFDAFKAQNLNLNMTRGKPSPEQLDLANGMLDVVSSSDFTAADGTDARNYGGLNGLTAAEALFAEYMEVSPSELIMGGNSSLAIMHDTLVRAVLFGTVDSPKPWHKEDKISFLCPVPGYDRHFAVCELLGIHMMPVPMNADGPHMDTVEALVRDDPSIRGMWCVPKYSNPGGQTYSDEVINRLAAMPTAAADFRIMWDNAYAVHHLVSDPPHLKNMLRACESAGNPERVYMFGSTSKISLAGAGVAMLAASERNISALRKQRAVQTIGVDKLNQLRHVRFFNDMNGIHTHMTGHAALLKPKFEAVDAVLTRELAEHNVATWSKPQGGYFVSLDTRPGLAKRVVALAEEAGVKLTPAGATQPYGNDPEDTNIRLAPSFPSLAEVEQAMEAVAVAVLLASST